MSQELDLKDRIKSVHLSKTEAKIAGYMIDFENRLCFMTAKDISYALGVSDTSVIRTCRKLGYNGYRDLQKQQQSIVSEYVEGDRYVIPSGQVKSKYEKYKESSTLVWLDLALENIRAAFNKNSAEKFQKAADLIFRSDHIFVAGFRGMAGMAEMLGIMLHQYIPFVDYYDKVDTGCVEKAIDLGENDCMILLSVERYSKMSRTLAEIAREQGCRLISIVDKITAPVAYKADLVLLSEFSGPTAMNSFLATQFIIEAILFEISRISGTTQTARLLSLDKNLEKLELY